MGTSSLGFGCGSSSATMDQGGERGAEEIQQLNDLPPEVQKIFKELENRLSDAAYGAEPPDECAYREDAEEEYEEYCQEQVYYFLRNPDVLFDIAEIEGGVLPPDCYSAETCEFTGASVVDFDDKRLEKFLWSKKGRDLFEKSFDKDQRFIDEWEQDVLNGVKILESMESDLAAHPVLARTVNENGTPLIASIDFDADCYDSIDGYSGDDYLNDQLWEARLKILRLLIDGYPPMLHIKAKTATDLGEASNDIIINSLVNSCAKHSWVFGDFIFWLTENHSWAFWTKFSLHDILVNEAMRHQGFEFIKDFYGDCCPTKLRDLRGQRGEPVSHLICHALSSRIDRVSSEKCLELVRWITTECPETVMYRMNTNKETLLHMLCKAQNSSQGSRAETIAFMTQTFPEILHLQDVNGKTPLFVLCERKKHMLDSERKQLLLKNTDLIALLIKACPEAAGIRSNKDELPLDELAPYSHITQVQDLIVSMSQALFPEIHLTGHSFADTVQLLIHCEIRMIKTMALLKKYQGLNSSSKVGLAYKSWAKDRFIALKHKMGEVRGGVSSKRKRVNQEDD